jgi:single-stranded DNA-binding protein
MLDEGRNVCTFTLAVDDIHSDDDRTDFLRVEVSGNPAALCERYLRNGFLAGVTGRLRADKREDRVRIIADNVRFLQWPEQLKQ